MNLKRKILIGYGAALMIMGAAAALSVTNLVALGRATDAILRENYRSILAAENMILSLERQDSGVLMIFSGAPESGLALFMKHEAEFLEWLGRACDNVTIAGETAVVSKIKAAFGVYRDAVHRQAVPSFGTAGQDSSSLIRENFYRTSSEYEKGILPLFESVRAACLELRHLNESTMYSASETAGAVASRAIWTTSVTTGAAFVLVLVFSIVLAGKITGPIKRFMDASRMISNGDYTVRIPVETNDELGSLAGEFNRMTEHLERYREMNIDQIIAEKNRIEAILTSISDGLMVFDTQPRVVGINPEARRIFSLDFSDSSNMSPEDAISDPKLASEIRKVIESNQGLALPDEERLLTIADGAVDRHFLFSVTPARGRDRKLAGAILLLRDVTRLKEVERVKSEFVMAASHELRTPLTSLGMSVDLLIEHVSGGLGDKERGLLHAAHEEVCRMKALVNELLDLSKLEAGKIEMEFETVEVTILFDRVREVFANQLAIKNVTLEVHGGAGLSILADVNKITWVITNLVSNALRYVHDKGIIEVTAIRIGEFAHLAVKDDGPGIPAEYQSRIFEKFAQISGRPGGTGLGLAICREIVRAHGGSIWVESEPGQGSSFLFTIPISGG